jgi:hypothetical protein
MRRIHPTSLSFVRDIDPGVLRGAFVNIDGLPVIMKGRQVEA